MNKALLTIWSLIFFSLIFMYFDINGQETDRRFNRVKSNFTFIQFSILPMFYEWPTGLNACGLRLGLPGSYGGDTYVYGLDWGLFFSESKNVQGAQFSFANWADNGAGVQLGLTNFAVHSDLMQIGVYNQSESKSSCFQIGLINVLENGFLPIFPIFNFSI